MKWATFFDAFEGVEEEIGRRLVLYYWAYGVYRSKHMHCLSKNQ